MAGKKFKPEDARKEVSRPYTSSWSKGITTAEGLAEREEQVRLMKHLTQVRKYKYTEESFGISLEPKYFWIVDFIKKIGFKPEKHMEQIGASVVSKFFGEMSARKQHLERRGMELISTVNTIVHSIINLLYDLREFDRRLKIYDDIDSDKPEQKLAAEEALKRVWMDEVDIKKGNGSILAMSSTQRGGLEFSTLRDAFVKANKIEDVNNMDLNDRVKQVLRGRLKEYIYWKEESGKELRQRKRIELAYLKAQLNSLKLYSQWARPYLEAAQRLSFEDVKSNDPELIQAFDQNVVRIKIRAKKEYPLKGFFQRGGLPRGYKPPETWSEKRKKQIVAEKLGPVAIGVIEVDFIYRTKPALSEYAQTGSAFRNLGKLEIEFKGYAMSKEEYDLLEKQEAFEAMKYIEGMTSETLDAMREDIERYLEEGEKEEKRAKAAAKPKAFLDQFLSFGGSSGGGGTPLLGGLTGFGEDTLVKRAKVMLRTEMADRIFTVYDIFKKAHKLLAFPYAPSFATSRPTK